MALRNKSRFWRRCRVLFRRLRIAVLFTVLVLLCGLIYLNQVGLPGFIKKPLQDHLRSRGLDLEFSRMRWRWYQGIVAENVRFGRSSSGPRLSARRARVQLDYRALAKLELRVNGLALQQGEFVWRIPSTNAVNRELTVQNIQTELRLLPGDLWRLEHFRARFAGADIQLAGVVTNASAVRDWSFLRSHGPSTPGALDNRLQRLAETLERIHFASPPQLRVEVDGDARDLQSFAVRLAADTPDAESPWGTVRNAALSAILHAATSNVSSHAEISLRAETAHTQWARQWVAVTNVALRINLVSTFPGTNVVYADLDLTAASAATKWGHAVRPHFMADWIHSVTNAIPLSGWGEFQADDIQSDWGRAEQGHVTGRLLSSTNAPAQRDEAWGWWNELAPYALDWECLLRGVKSPKLEAGELFCAGEWLAPEVKLTQISGALYGGKLGAQAHLDVATRRFRFSGSSDFDPHGISPLLTEKSRHWLAQYSWNGPPDLQAEGALILPAWTNRQVDWRGEVRPTVRLNGSFRVANGAFRDIPFRSAESHFSYSNLVWRLPDLIARRPEGWLSLVHESDERTRDYYFRVHSTIDPQALRPLFETNQQRAFDLVGFTQPPVVDAEIWGRWYDHDRIGGKATVAVNDFKIRGEPIGHLETQLQYTNRFLLCLNPRAERGAERASAASVGVDFTARKVYLTNGLASADPAAVSRMIGPKAGATMVPYHFLQPPAVRVEGVIPMHNEREADLHFDVDGGPFEWWKFKLPRIAGRVDWAGEQLALRGVRAEFYRGTAAGNAEFDFQRGEGVDFRFQASATNTDFHLLMDDLGSKTNRLEGRLSADLAITEGSTRNLRTLAGRGSVDLRDGLIWDIPIFGILSPVLDGIAPGLGLGSSRAREGSATFVITNGVIRSDDLEIRASMMRLQYWGTVDMKGQVNARAQAELLRDTWAVGRVISLALWPVSKVFEYKITGTLHQPRSDPVFFIPRIVLLPFHPIRSMKELMEEPPYLEDSNAPPFRDFPNGLP